MAFTCPTCGKSSAHPVDEQERYCGACHTFAADAVMRAMGVVVTLNRRTGQEIPPDTFGLPVVWDDTTPDDEVRFVQPDSGEILARISGVG